MREPENHISLIIQEGQQHLFHKFRRVLSIAMQQDDGIKIHLDGIEVAYFLITP